MLVSITVSDGSLTDTITVLISVIDIDDTVWVSTLVPVSDRTPEVRDAIVDAVSDVSDAADVTATHLATITALNLRAAGISSLESGDFSGLSALTNLNLYGNMLSRLPVGIFEGLTALTTLRLGGNTVDPMPLIVSLQQVDANQYQAIILAGAPFDVVVSIDATTVTIPQGSVKSDTFTVIDIPEIGVLPMLPANHFGYTFSKSTACNRTSQVAAAIAVTVPGVTDCQNVTEIDLAGITELDLSNKSITSLKEGDFSGMLSLTMLDLSNNQLSSLSPSIFEDMLSLKTLNLSGNTVALLPLTIALQKVGENQFKAVLPIGAPFAINLSVNVMTGNIVSGAITVTISQGSMESQPQTVTRTAGTTAAVTVDIGTMPSLPAMHSGYTLAKSDNLPLEILESINVAPVFTDGSTTTRSIPENTDAGVNIGSAVAATDANNDTLTYTLSGDDAGLFDIVSTTGQLQTKAPLDYETEDSYSVTITVSDSILTDTITVTINVTDKSELPPTDDAESVTETNNAPVFTESDSATRSVAENTGSGVDIGSPISATDADDDTLEYSLGGINAGSFTIDTTTGQLRTSAALDFETKSSYTVEVTVSDSTDTDTITVTINVTNVDEDPVNVVPVFTEGSRATRSVAENTGSGVDIGNAVSATDANGNTLTYTLGGTDAAVFSIDSSSGQLRTSAALDYETKDTYSVTITVSDGKGGSATITVTISVTNVDEALANNDPVFTEDSNTTRSIAENTGSGVDIGSAVSATDDDNDTLTYSLSGTNSSAFSIDSSSGQLQTSAALDYETKSSYTVTITVSDENGGTATINVTIDVTNVNEAPVFADGTSTTRTIAENAGANINIGNTVAATDVDGDTLTYTLDRNPDAASFDIESTTGQLKTKAALDFETKSSYTVAVSVSDSKGGTDSITVTITVRDLDETPSNIPPVFTEGDDPVTRSVAENMASGTNIGAAVSATDADSNTLAYLLSGDDASSFSIDADIGQLKTGAALNYETKASYTVTITVSDGSLTDTINVTISVTNANDPPVFNKGLSTTLSIAENTDATNIGDAFTATDEDGNTLTYSLHTLNDVTPFRIDTSNGQLRTLRPLDYEETPSYTVTIAVDDGKGGFDEIEVTINVTDVVENVAPVFTEGDNAAREVAENTGSGVNIGTLVAATDADDGDTLTYSLGGTDAAAFEISSTTGQLRTKTPLDYETKNSYAVTVTVSDGNGGSAEIAVTISVTDVDENRAPVFADGQSTDREVAENTGSGVNIGTAVSATDADDDTLTYSLGGDDASSFSINTTKGQLRTHAALDYETKDTYSVTITVDDDNGGSAEIAVTISVTDVNENRAPVFSDGVSTTREVAENTAAGENIGTAVSATDADNDNLTYTLGGDDAAAFNIVGTTGQLQTSAALDFETKSSYSVTVAVSDDSATDEIEVTVTVTDVDENRAPVFTQDSTTRSVRVSDDTTNLDNVGDPVTAVDPDADTLTYTLSGTDAAFFNIVDTTGQLRVNISVISDSKTTYSVIVTASDENGGSDSITVTISVTRVPLAKANNAPEFTDGDSTTRSVAENTGSGVNIGAPVSATDADTLTYSLGGTDASVFSIESSSGQLKTSASLDYETKDSYSVTITVSDGKGGSDSIDVTISVTDVDENSAPIAVGTISVDTLTAAIPSVQIDVSGNFEDLDDETLIYTASSDDISVATVSVSGSLVTITAGGTGDVTITVTASDGTSAATQTISVTVNAALTEEDWMPDANLRAKVRAALGLQEGEALTQQAMTRLTTFDAYVSQIENLTGLEYATNLTSLNLNNNQISDISALENLTSLTTLWLFVNQISDISALENLTSLTTLRLSVNQISDISALENLTSLTTLWLSGNQVSDISALENLTSLTTLRLFVNQISDISALENLTSLTRLYLSNNHISDISALENLTSLTWLNLNNNQISDISALENLTSLTTLRLSVNQVSDISALENLTALTELHLSGNQISDYGPLRRLIAAIAEITEHPGLTLDITIPDASSSNSTPVFTESGSTTRSIAENTDSGVNIGNPVAATDANNDNLTYSLGGTDASSFSIVSTTGQLQTSAALDFETDPSYTVTVSVSDGKGGTASITVTINVIDVDESYPLAGRTQEVQGAIVALVDGKDSAADVTVEDLAAITYLYLFNKDITSLKVGDFDGLTALTDISMSGNTLSSLPSGIFDNNTTLTDISLSGNALSSLPSGIFDNNTALTDISLSGNALSSLPSGIFDNNTALTDISLSGNTLSSFPSGIFDNNTALTALHLNNNALSSLPSGIFDNNTALTTLYIAGNVLSSLPSGIFDNNTALTTLSLTGNALTSLPSGIFDNNTTLTTLSLTRNALSSLPDGIFDNNTALTALYLNVNVLSSLPSGIFDNNTTLTMLYLSFNDISDISELEELTSLTNLKLSGNQISDYGPLRRLIAAIAEITEHPGLTLDITIPDASSSNSAPVFTESGSTTRSIAENTDSGVNIGNPVAATDANNDNLTYSLGGTDASSFSIVGTTGQLQTSAALDFETDSSYTVTVSVSDGKGGTASITVTITVLDVVENRAPRFSDGASTTRSVAENTDSGIDIGSAVTATDADNDTLTYSLSGDPDAASFSIVRTSGQLQTKNALDRETKPSYSVTVSVSDGNGGTDSITVTINVTNVNEAPEFSDGSSTTRSINENAASGQNIGTAVAATDEDSDTLTYTLGGTNASSFSIVDTTGQLQTKSALDHETKDSYEVTITVSDGNGGSDSITVTITVTDVSEVVLNAIVAAAGVNSAAELTAEHLTAITSLDLSSKSMTSLKVGDFDGLTALTTLDLSDNNLSELPSGIFDKLTRLQFLELDNNSFSTLPSGIFEKLASSIFVVEVSGNTVDPLPLTVSLSKVNEGQFKAVAPTGAPFDIVVPITVTNGSMSGATSVTISIGAVESPTHTVTRTTGTTAAATVNIGTLPGIRSTDTGYELVKPTTGLPLTVIAAVGGSPYSVSNTDPQVPQETALFPNYPNPSNPETWIPYQLSKSAKVTLTIYSMRGVVVRTLALGHQQAGVYRSRSRAVYWDGKNENGESVASSVYFYVFKAGEIYRSAEDVNKKVGEISE